jgi:hypothetical protein
VGITSHIPLGVWYFDTSDHTLSVAFLSHAAAQSSQQTASQPWPQLPALLFYAYFSLLIFFLLQYAKFAGKTLRIFRRKNKFLKSFTFSEKSCILYMQAKRRLRYTSRKCSISGKEFLHGTDN